MEETIRYKRDEILYFIPQKVAVRVLHNTLKAGGVNADEAFVTVRSKGGGFWNIPVAIQDDVLRPHVEPMQVEDTEIEETDGELVEDE